MILLMVGLGAGTVASSVTLRGQTIGTFTWSHNAEKLEVTCRGDVEFSDDDMNVRRLTPGAVLRITERRRAGARSLELTADSAGNIKRRFSVDASERPFETEGRQWLSQILPPLIRHTGIGATARVARILRMNGPAGVLAEISLIEGSWSKRVYFAELLKLPGLGASARQQALAQAAREMDSEPELAALLAANRRLLRDEGTRQAYLAAAQTIGSDFEMRRLLSTALEGGTVTSGILAGVLEISAAIGSDVELASLLVQVARLQALDNVTRGPFFTALDALNASPAEHGRVLLAVMEQQERSPEIAAAILASAGGLKGDHEAARLLAFMATHQPIEGALRAPFFRRVASVASPFDRSRVLQTVARREDASEETLTAILGFVHGMTAKSEAAQVLLAVAETHTLSGPARDAYIDAAKHLGHFDRARALTALAGHERHDLP